MTVLIIIAAVIGLIVLLLNFPVRVLVSIKDGKANIRVKYLFIEVYPRKERPERPPKPQKERKKKENSEDVPPQEEQSTPVMETSAQETQTAKDPPPRDETADADGSVKEPQEDAPDDESPEREKKEPLMTRINNFLDGLNEKKQAFQLLWELCFGPVKKLLLKIRIDSVVIDFAAADEDAYNAAMLYGKMNAAVWNVIGWLKAMTHIKLSSVKVDCLFDSPKDKTRYDGSCTVKLRPASVVNAIGKIGFGYLFHLKKYSPALQAFRK